MGGIWGRGQGAQSCRAAHVAWGERSRLLRVIWGGSEEDNVTDASAPISLRFTHLGPLNHPDLEEEPEKHVSCRPE